jgi:hypothetical protein
MIQSEIDTIKDIVELPDIILTTLNSKGYDLKLVDNRHLLNERKKLQKLQKKYPLVEEIVLEMIIIHEEEEEFTNNEWTIYLQSEYDSIIKYAKSKEEVQKIILKEVEENSEFDVYDIYYKYKSVDFEIETKINIDMKKDDMEIISQKEYDHISSLYINFDVFINNRKSLRYNELERLIKQFDGLFSLECTDNEYYILYDDGWKVKGSTLMLIAQAFNIYIETKLNKYKEKQCH